MLLGVKHGILSQEQEKPFSVWAWWIVHLMQGCSRRETGWGGRRGREERGAYPGLWEVHQNSRYSSSSRCQQSWACLLSGRGLLEKKNLFHAVMPLSVCPLPSSSSFPVLLSPLLWDSHSNTRDSLQASVVYIFKYIYIYFFCRSSHTLTSPGASRCTLAAIWSSAPL